MTIYCNTEIMSALNDLQFPKSKSEIIDYAKMNKNLSEASIVALNRLDEKVYNGLDEICENIKIVCSFELRNALKDLSFPVTKAEIMDFMIYRKYPTFIIQSLEELPDGIVFNDINDVCR